MGANMGSLKIKSTILAALILYLIFPSETTAVHKHIYSSPNRSPSPHINKFPPLPPSAYTPSPPVYKFSPPSPLVYKSPHPPSPDYKAPPPLFNRTPSLPFHKSAPSPPLPNYKSPSSQPLVYKSPPMDYKSSSTPLPNFKVSPPPPLVCESSPPTYMSPPPIYNIESKMIIALCLTYAVKMAFHFIPNYIDHPFQLHLLSLAIGMAFASLFAGNFVSYNFPSAAYVLEQASAIFAVTAFIIAISVPFPNSIKCMIWLVYAVAWLAILICNYLG